MIAPNGIIGLVSGITLLGLHTITPTPLPGIPAPISYIGETSSPINFYLNLDDFMIKNSHIAGTVPNTPTPTATNTPTPRPPTMTPTPKPLPATSLDTLFERYANEYHVDMNMLKKIALCESGYNPNSNAGAYLGMFQFSEGAWVNARTAMGMDPNKDLRTNGEESIRTAAFYISKHGTGAWPTCSK